jgi:hypothetical protein
MVAEGIAGTGSRVAGVIDSKQPLDILASWQVPVEKRRLASIVSSREGGCRLTRNPAHRRGPPRIVATLLRSFLVAAALLAAIAPALFAQTPPPEESGGITDWPSYGGDLGKSRYTPLGDIRAENLSKLEIAWTYRTGDVAFALRD